MSSSTDITAWVLVFPPVEKDGVYQVLCRFFIPEDKMRERVARDKVMYDVWCEQGLITPTPGNVIDEDFILEQIRKDTEQFVVKELAYDAWGSTKIVADLQKIGFIVDEDEKKDRILVKFRQGEVSMSPPLKDLEKLALNRKLAHGGNPVLAWMCSNLVVHMGPTGLIKPDKAKSTERIDGMVALVMGLDRAMKKKAKTSVYETRGVVVM